MYPVLWGYGSTISPVIAILTRPHELAACVGMLGIVFQVSHEGIAAGLMCMETLLYDPARDLSGSRNEVGRDDPRQKDCAVGLSVKGYCIWLLMLSMS